MGLKNMSLKNLLKTYSLPSVSFVMLIIGLTASFAHVDLFENQWIRFGWYFIAYLLVGLVVMREAWESVLEKDIFSEYLLMSLATIGAFFIGEYPEGVAVMLFYTIGEIFQEKAVHHAKKSIDALLAIRPDKATVVTADSLKSVPPEEVSIGEIIEVKTGERVPLDGLLLNDSATFNTSALTGESIPREIKKEEEVSAGMIVTNHVIRLKTIRSYGQSALSRILELVENAAERKAPAEQFIRKFARIYTPTVIVLALLIVILPWLYAFLAPTFTYNFNNWFYKGLVFLVISCPCALVISIPLSYFSGIGAASKEGVLFKGSNYLEAITHVNTIVFDKTGTLTQGIFEIQEIVSAGRLDTIALLKTMAAVESKSTHPIAKAIVDYARIKNISPDIPDRIAETGGLGLTAELNGEKIIVGNAELLDRYAIDYPPAIREIPETTVLCAIENVYAGYVRLADALKTDAYDAVTALNKCGIKNFVVLSGDKQALVTHLATKLGITQAYGDLLPEGKVKQIESLQANPSNMLAFVGDGINDAPVLALCDVGIAMGGLGSEAAIEAADVVIQTDRLIKIATAIRLGRFTRRIVIQNICMAIGLKILILSLAVIGMASLWEAVFADVGVTLLAVVNSLRILKAKV
ncbi:MAG: cadmium-translocating P-type ATPase [Candidatus Symbiothrix sp.]|jgi:Cd2+/Zn2+-exporting ATPase|nr:cadmium-translocating P-type ATPase [Candidatus Symbiothrix sp.]